MEARPYQAELFNTLENKIHDGSTKIIIDSPTGSGKSFIISKITQHYRQSNVFIVTNVAKLIDQLHDTLRLMGIDHSVLKAGMDTLFNPNSPVQLIMEQTYHARKGMFVFPPCHILIKDEYHIAWNGTRFQEMLDELKPNIILGTTATPYDEFGVAIPDHEYVRSSTVKELVDQGYLSQMRTYIPPEIEAMSFEGIGSSGDYTESELDELTNTDWYNDVVVRSWILLPRQTGGHMKTICFVGGIHHAEKLASKFREYGINARAVHSKQNPAERNEIMDNFDGRSMSLFDHLAGNIEVLVGVSSLHTGYDAPDIECVINARPTKRRSLFTQMVGRGLRIHPDLDYAIHLDCAHATSTHGLYDEEFTPYENKEIANKIESVIREERKAIMDYAMKKYGADEHITRITSGRLNSSRKEIEQGVNLEALKAQFDTAQDPYVLLTIGAEIYKRVYGIETSMNTMSWIMQTMERGVRRFGIKSYKTRLRNIIKNKQKITSIYYFEDYLDSVSRRF